MLTSFSISFYIFGWIFVIYIVISFVFMIISGFLYKFTGSIELKIQKLRDKRITFLTNVFKNIRFVKFNVYENFFAKYIYDLRKKEISSLTKYYLVVGFVIFINWLCPGASISGLFACYFYFNQFMNIGLYTAFMQVVLEVEMVFRFVPYIM